MKQDAAVIHAFDRAPPPERVHGFAHTSPLEPALARDMARIFGPLEVQTIRASMVDLESMACKHAWRITEDGALVDDPIDRGPGSTFRSAMATIVHLNRAPAEQTLTRKLDPRRWAFAWRVDERSVAVAEACYRQPRSEPGEVDTALVRMICDRGIRAGSLEPAQADNDRQAARAKTARRPTLPQAVATGVLVACLAAAAAVLALRQQAVAPAAEAAALVACLLGAGGAGWLLYRQRRAASPA